MTSIKRSDLQTALTNKSVDVADLKNAENLSSTVKAKLATADTNGDGVIEGTKEIDKLFAAADHFDVDGSRNTIAAERNGAPTVGLTALATAVAVAKPRRGLGGDQASSSTSAAGAAAGTQAGTKTNLDDSFRTFRDVDVEKLKEKLPSQAKHLAEAFVESGRRHNVDPLLLASISKHETASWTSSAFKNKNNAMGVSGRTGPLRMSSHAASIEKMASLVGSTESGPYKSANTYRQLWSIYAPGPATGQGRQTNDPNNLNRSWGPSIIKNIDNYSAALR